MNADELFTDIVKDIPINMFAVDVVIDKPHHVYAKIYKGSKKNKDLLSNEKLAQYLGLGSASNIIDASDEDLWPYSLDQIYSNDELVMKKGGLIIVPEIQVMSRQWEAFDAYSVKRPLYNEGKEIIGVEGISFVIKREPSKNIELSKHFMRLSEKQRRCLLLMMKGFHMRTIAKSLNVSERSAYYLHKRGMKQLGCQSFTKFVVDYHFLLRTEEEFVFNSSSKQQKID